MSEYIPDRWVVVKITALDNPPIHKVFACWYGGYLGSDSWKLNSGITRAYEEGHCFMFDGSSGSTYTCHKSHYGTNGYGAGVLQNMISNASKNGITIEILPEETNWLEINYE
jgi:hypothetical protein